MHHVYIFHPISHRYFNVTCASTNLIPTTRIHFGLHRCIRTLNSTCRVLVFIRICRCICWTIGVKIFNQDSRNGVNRWGGTGTRRDCSFPPCMYKKIYTVTCGYVKPLADGEAWKPLVHMQATTCCRASTLPPFVSLTVQETEAFPHFHEKIRLSFVQLVQVLQQQAVTRSPPPHFCLWLQLRLPPQLRNPTLRQALLHVPRGS